MSTSPSPSFSVHLAPLLVHTVNHSLVICIRTSREFLAVVLAQVILQMWSLFNEILVNNLGVACVPAPVIGAPRISISIFTFDSIYTVPRATPTSVLTVTRTVALSAVIVLRVSRTPMLFVVLTLTFLSIFGFLVFLIIVIIGTWTFLFTVPRFTPILFSSFLVALPVLLPSVGIFPPSVFPQVDLLALALVPLIVDLILGKVTLTRGNQSVLTSIPAILQRLRLPPGICSTSSTFSCFSITFLIILFRRLGGFALDDVIIPIVRLRVPVLPIILPLLLWRIRSGA